MEASKYSKTAPQDIIDKLMNVLQNEYFRFNDEFGWEFINQLKIKSAGKNIIDLCEIIIFNGIKKCHNNVTMNTMIL